MGKKNKPALGKSIIKHRSRSGGNITHANSWLHCSELDDDVGPSIQSVTEQNALDDFLATAELAGTEFTAEKLNAMIVSPRQNEGLLSRDAVKAIQQAQQENEHFLRIPRRPDWDQNMTADELDQKEKESFLQWRRQLAQLQEKEHILLTPFERNLDFWRQLWRVIERSDVVVQIVDARNPLLYRCEDLEHYVTEVDHKKCFLLLINKADFLTPEQRGMWARYFSSIGLRAVFWSAQLESERLAAMKSSDDWDKEKNVEKNELDETSEEHDARLPSRFSEMSLEMESDSEEEDGRMTIIGSERGGSGRTVNQSRIQDGEIENDMGESPNRTTDGHHETAVEILSGDSSCKSEVVTSQHTPCLSATDTECFSRPGLNVPSNTEQIRQHSKRDDGVNGQKGTSDRSEEDKLQSNYHTEQGIDSNEMQVLQDSHLLDTSSRDVNFCGKILTKDELLALFKMLHLEKREQSSSTETTKMLTTVGLVGYPNVGKSSTINTLLNDKKVPVSATPGRTKHFQTLYVNEELLLCDCPGLVFPSFVSTKAEMILNGILPIDQMRDHVPPVSLICQRIPRDVLEVVYGLNIPLPQEGEDPNRAAYADELLSAYGYMRGFMTSHGVPDCARSARYILKDYVKGKLLYCIAPPVEDEKNFQQIGLKVEKYMGAEGKVKKTQETSRGQMSNVDKDFFKQERVRCFSRGFHATGRQFPMAPTAQGTTSGTVIGGEGPVPYKPWKKHYNRNKREKLRRLAKN